MRTQYNVRSEHLSHDEIAEVDRLFLNAGWIICGINDTIGSHIFRIYQWDKDDVAPNYPEGYEQEPHMERIDLGVLAYPVDD